ncbi:MAG: restriction endonuclease subunit S [Bacteroidales bacterium]|nr:restriction endonuclease subunit S [Bacteroidales bacterium]
MRKGWEIKKIGEICEVLNGGTPDTKVKEYWDGENLWITPKDMGKLNSIYVNDTERKITAAGLKNSSAKVLPPNSVILSSRAPIGHLAINTKPIATNQGCKGIVPSDKINKTFLYYFLKNSIQLLNDLGSGTTFKELSGSKLSLVEIPIPPLPEQHRIVAILDAAFAAIDKARANIERNIQNARDLFQSKLEEIFTVNKDDWREEKLDNVAKIMYGYTTKSSNNGNAKLLRITDIQNNEVDWSAVPYCKIEKDDYSKYKLKDGDIVFARTGATTGKSYLVKNPPTSVFASYLIRLQNNADILDPEFLFLFFQTSTYWDRINTGISGSAQGGFNASKLKELIVCFPNDKKDQHRIIHNLNLIKNKIQILESKYSNKANELDHLKKSILQKAFNGELT